MKTFKQILAENRPFMVYKGIKVIDTKHSIERTLQRVPHLSKDDFEIIFKRAIDRIMLDYNYFVSASHYLIYSKEYQQGIIVNFREDKYDNDGKKHLIVITVLPPRKQVAKPGTHKMIVESFENSIILESDEVREYLYDLLNEDISNIEYDEISKNELTFIIVDGKIHDLNVDIIEVD